MADITKNPAVKGNPAAVRKAMDGEIARHQRFRERGSSVVSNKAAGTKTNNRAPAVNACPPAQIPAMNTKPRSAKDTFARNFTGVSMLFHAWCEPERMFNMAKKVSSSIVVPEIKPVSTICMSNPTPTREGIKFKTMLSMGLNDPELGRQAKKGKTPIWAMAAKVRDVVARGFQARISFKELSAGRMARVIPEKKRGTSSQYNFGRITAGSPFVSSQVK